MTCCWRRASARNFRVKLVEGLKATERGPALVEQGLMLATALAPEIGYDAARSALAGWAAQRMPGGGEAGGSWRPEDESNVRPAP